MSKQTGLTVNEQIARLIAERNPRRVLIVDDRPDMFPEGMTLYNAPRPLSGSIDWHVGDGYRDEDHRYTWEQTVGPEGWYWGAVRNDSDDTWDVEWTAANLRLDACIVDYTPRDAHIRNVYRFAQRIIAEYRERNAHMDENMLPTFSDNDFVDWDMAYRIRMSGDTNEFPVRILGELVEYNAGVQAVIDGENEDERVRDGRSESYSS